MKALIFRETGEPNNVLRPAEIPTPPLAPGEALVRVLLSPTILHYLTVRRIFHYRNNSRTVKADYKGKNRLFYFGALGSPDIICVVNGRYIGIEVKGPGGEQGDNQ